MTKRFERREIKAQLTARDLAIVKAVFEARYMTGELVWKLFFTPTTRNGCKRRLRVLFDLGYLKKRPMYANTPDLYFLGLQGRKYLAGEYDREWLDKVAGIQADDPRDTLLWMPHEVMLARLYVYARLEGERRGWLVSWRNSRMLELLDLGVQPDAWIQVSKGDNSRQGFIEFSDQLNRVEVEKKMVAYRQHLPEAQVLWFVTSKAKAQLVKTLADEQFAVALIDDCSQWLTAPIWSWEGGQTPFISVGGESRP